MADETPDQLGLLLTVLTEDEISAGEFDQLEQLLLSDPAARDRYADYILMHAQLQWRYSLGACDAEQQANAMPVSAESLPTAALPLVEHAPSPLGRLRHIVRDLNREPVAAAVAASVLLALVVSVLAFIRLSPNQPPAPTAPSARIAAMITASGEAVWAADSDGNARTGDLIVGDVLRLESGLAAIEFVDGAQVILEGPTELKIEGRGAAQLNAGRLGVFVPPPAVGFTVRTRHSTIVDLGTEFGVGAGPEQETDVQVFDGEVEIAWNDPQSPQRRVTHVVAGQRATVSDRSLTLTPDTSDTQSFAALSQQLQRAAPPGMLVRYRMTGGEGLATTHPADFAANGLQAGDFQAIASGGGVSYDTRTAYLRNGNNVPDSPDAALAQDCYFSFTLAPRSGWTLQLSGLTFRHGATTSKEEDFFHSHLSVRSSADDFQSDLAAFRQASVVDKGKEGQNHRLPLDDPRFQQITGPLEIRFYFHRDAQSGGARPSLNQYHRLANVALFGRAVRQQAGAGDAHANAE